MDFTNLEQVSGSPGCVVCDNNGSNPRSLNLKIYWDSHKRHICIPCTPDSTWCGYTNVVHGGLIATILDESMAWAVKQTIGEWAFTVDFSLRLKASVNPGKTYEAVAYVLEQTKRKITTESLLMHEEKVVASSKAIFLCSKK